MASTDTNKRQQLISSIPGIVLGLILVAWPGGTLEAAGVATGIACAVEGLLWAPSALKEKDSKQGIFAAVLVVVGILMMLNSKAFASILPVLIGLAAVAYAVWCFMGLRNTEGKQRVITIIVAALCAVLGVAAIAFPFATASVALAVCGIALLVGSLLGIVKTLL